MSGQLSRSDSYSMDQGIMIHANNLGQNQVHIGVWDQEGSSSHTQVTYLMQEVKVLKNRCQHLQSHIESIHMEFTSLNQLYLISQNNQRRLIRENEELRRRQKETNHELIHLRVQLENAVAELALTLKRQNQWRDEVKQYKTREMEFNSMIQKLEIQIEDLRRRSVSTSHQSEEERWKKYYSEQIILIQTKWRKNTQKLENDLQREVEGGRVNAIQLKKTTKLHEKYKEESASQIKQLQVEYEEEKKRDLQRAKAQHKGLEDKLKQLRAVLEDVSAKNDDLERQKGNFKKKLDEEIIKNRKVVKELKDLQKTWSELKIQFEQLEKDYQKLKNQHHDSKSKLTLKQRELNELRIQIKTLQDTKEYLQKGKKGLRDELQQMKRTKEEELQHFADSNEQRIKDIKKINEEDKNRLNNTVYSLQKQINQLRVKISVITSQLTETDGNNEDKEELLKVREDLLKARDDVGRYKRDLERANNTIKELHNNINSGSSCGHEEQMDHLSNEIQKGVIQNQRLSKQIEQHKLTIDDQKNKLNYTNAKIAELQGDNLSLTEVNRNIQKENASLLETNRKLQGQLKRARQELVNSRRAEGVSDSDRIKELEGINQQSNDRIAELEDELETLKTELQMSRKKGQQRQSRQFDKQKVKKLEQKVRQKQTRIAELEEELEQIQSQIDQSNEQNKNQEKELRLKEKELSNRDRKIKSLESELLNLKTKGDENQQELQQLKEQIDTFKGQHADCQATIEKLRQQARRRKQSMGKGDNYELLYQQSKKSSEQWQLKYINLETKLQEKQSLIEKLRIQVERFKSQGQNNQSNNQPKSSVIESQLKETIRNLREQNVEKETIISNLREQLDRKGSNMQGEGDSETLQRLQDEYKRQLNALKRLIVYKGSRQDDSKKYDQIKNDYEIRIDGLLKEYNLMQQEMYVLREEVLISHKPVVVREPTVDMMAIEEVWRRKVEEVADERQVLLQRVGVWQERYEQLRCLFQAKLQSKEQAINLLNLKISNIQLGRSRTSCTCFCSHQPRLR